jgi:histidinol-phosphate aminotransferase
VSLPCLRDGLPPASPLTVTALPHRAKLDQNEAPSDVPDDVKRVITGKLASQAWNRYPQPAHYVVAKEAVAAVLGVDPARLFVAVGGDQTILSAFHLGGGPGRLARWFEPSYPYVALAARVTHTSGGAVELGAEIDSLLSAEHVLCEPQPDLVALVSPNNPTGGLCPDEVVAAALANRRRLVFIDEAYANFANHTRIHHTERHDNLLIGRSLSKAMLAGVRLGLCIGHPDMIAALDRVYTAPYHLNLLQLTVASEMAVLAPLVDAAATAVVAERERVANELQQTAGVTPYPSRANFVLFRVDGGSAQAGAVYTALTRMGIRIRDVGRVTGLAGHLRVTIGQREENDLFLELLAAAL